MKETLSKIKKQLIEGVFDFEETAMKLYDIHRKYNPTYQYWLKLLNRYDLHPKSLDEIPCLPVSIFKNHTVLLEEETSSIAFTSSTTTGKTPSTHHITDLSFYHQNTTLNFSEVYGDPTSYCFLGLLPSYLERSGSSLISMVEHFISKSKYPQSGFYLYNHDQLAEVLEYNKEGGIPTILFGVTYALLDFVDARQMHDPELIVIETGGMKGRKKEMPRSAIHQILKFGFGVDQIHSEYGMTEMQSQAYAIRDGIFKPSSTMKVIPGEMTNPLAIGPYNRSATIKCIDLANVTSCPFLATEDIGIIYPDGRFSVMGRLDHSEIRGCNLMVSDLE